MNLDAAFKTFIDESLELLQTMEDRLLAIAESEDWIDSINSIFRVAHTIKGSAGIFGLDGIVKFTHVVENVLDRVRAKTLPLDEDLTNLLLLCKDYIKHLIESIENSKEIITADDKVTEGNLLTQLAVYVSVPKADQPAIKPATQPAQTSGISDETTVGNNNWHISLHFGPDVLRNGMDPLSFLRFLGTIGTIENIVTLYDAVPPATHMDPETCYLGYEINFNSKVDKATIENAFEFVKDDCQIRIVPPHGKATEFLEIIDSLSSEDLKLGEILVRCGTLTQRELDNMLQQQSKSGEADTVGKRRLGEIAVEQGLVEPAVVEAALQKQEQLRKCKDKKQQSVRVDADKLDQLINLIGELVIAGSGIEMGVRRGGFDALVEPAQTLIRMIEDVRDSALTLRMVQIGETFNRFQRVVRDVSRELGKDIELVISGGETELDKTVVEKISDPLTHLVRNSIDHGIEPQDVRVQHGKSVTGTVRLNAYHESGSIVIEVSDDGAGLNRDRILAKAIEKGLVPNDNDLTDKEIYKLIFEAGFSTAEQVSNLSGRGVGMDVVRRNIEALRGSIELESTAGAGTTTRIRLPLTLAIIDGFMMGVGNASYVVPLDIVEECRELTDSESNSTNGQEYINLRGEVLPFIRLREHFNEAGKAGKRENIVVVKYGNHKAGFVVDHLMGEFQTVIKPLGALFEHLKGISGSTILGSGEVALILDTPALITSAINRISH